MDHVVITLIQVVCVGGGCYLNSIIFVISNMTIYFEQPGHTFVDGRY